MGKQFDLSARRQFLTRVSALVGSALLLPWIGANVAMAQGSKVEAKRISDKVLFVKGPDSNVIVVNSNEGLILVDGGHASWYPDLQKALTDNFPGQKVRALINTHWHPDQTGANVPLGEQGVEIIAHENTKLWLSTEVWQRWSDTTFPPLADAGLPKTTFFEDGSLQIGDTKVQYGYMREAHTDGDIWVYFEDADVLVTGGLVSNGRWPEIDWWTGGFIAGMLDGFVSLLTVPTASTTIVPAYGDIMTLDELRAQNQMYLTIFDHIHGSFIKSESLEEILSEKPTAAYDSKMGDPTRFLTLAFQSIQGHIRDPQNDRFLNIP